MMVEAVELDVIQEERIDYLGAPPAAWPTMEHGLYALILLMAAGVRFFALGEQPLIPLEAANAWPAWLAATATTAPAPPTPTSPLLYSIHTLLFWITGGGDAVARAIPALAGVGAVALSWWLRPWLGRLVALLVALLLAVDPWLTALSRLADGAALTLFFGLLTLVGLLHLHGKPADGIFYRRWRNLTAVSAGLLLISGPLAWSFAPVMLWFLWLFLGGRLGQRPLGLLAWSQPSPSLVGEAEEPVMQAASLHYNLQGARTSLLLFLASVLLGATGWLAQPEALGLVSHSLSTWFTHLFGSATNPYTLGWPFLRLFIDQPLILVFGLIGLVQLWLRIRDRTSLITHHSWPPFLTGWLLWGLLLVLVPGRNPLSLPMLGLPLLLAAASAIADMLGQLQQGTAWRERLLLYVMLTVLLVWSTFLVWALVSQFQLDTAILFRLLLFLLLAALLVVLFALFVDWRQAWASAGAYLAVVLLLATLSSLWQLNGRALINRPEGFWAEVTASDVRHLVADVQTLSAQRMGDATQIPLLVQMDAPGGRLPDPVLGWYLRNMRHLEWVLAPDVQSAPPDRPPLVITSADHVDDASLAAYRGSRYATHVRWLPNQLPDTRASLTPTEGSQGLTDRINIAWNGRWRAFLRWAFYREVKEALPTEQVILWVRSE